MDKRIIINEIDATTSGSTLSSTDVVYVPGFCYYAETEYNDQGELIGTYGQVGQPVLCTSLAEFKQTFGSIPAVFKTSQKYPLYVQGSQDGFLEKAIPSKVVGAGDDAADERIWFQAGDVDPSYIYACELLSKGIPVVYERLNKMNCTADEGNDVTVENLYEKLFEVFSHNDDLSQDRQLLTSENLPIKYFTTGGYPSLEYVKASGDEGIHLSLLILQMAETRGDAFALLDHTNHPTRKLYGEGSVFQSVNLILSGRQEEYDTYGAVITPWGRYDLVNTYNYQSNANQFNGELPGSFAYLSCVGKVIKTNPSWSTIAGVTRGNVPQLQKLALADNRILTNAIANAYQPEMGESDLICINAITNIKGYGYCIWGNRTLREQRPGRTGYALNFLNIRNLICDIKKVAYDTSVRLMFEPNNITLWGNFKGSLTPTLDKMKASQAISDYQIIKLASDDKTKLRAQINIYPMYSVEKFEININITDETVNVA